MGFRIKESFPGWEDDGFHDAIPYTIEVEGNSISNSICITKSYDKNINNVDNAICIKTDDLQSLVDILNKVLSKIK